jgi:phosphatidylglycerophosphate synthase
VRQMAQRFGLDEIRARTYKARDSWWTVWLVDPLASRLVWLISPWRWITPNRLTISAFALGVGAAACFWQQSYPWLVAGALLFHLSFVIDCMDGKIARLNGTGSVFGAWLDYVFDRLRVLVCTLALMGGQYVRTGNFAYIWLAGMVIFLDLFRYLNALQISKVKQDMKAKLAAARGLDDPEPMFLEEAGNQHPVGDQATAATALDGRGTERPVVDVYGDFRNRFSLFVRVRNALIRQRIRAHLFSGIEFQMAIFIIAPLTGWIIGTSAGAGALLAGFELLIIYKLWTATKGYTRLLARIQADSATRTGTGDPVAVEAVGGSR